MTTFWYQHQVSLVVFLAVILVIAIMNACTLRRLASYPPPSSTPRLSVLIPARNERGSIDRCLRSLMAQEYPDYEVLVLDDGSTDDTASAVAAMAKQDSRLRLLTGQPLPANWLGKAWACQQLADAASGTIFLFVDADTIHHPKMLEQGTAALEAEKADLLTGFLHQEILSWGERLTVPVAMWCFFSFLPVPLAHRWRAPWLSLSNGQWMMFRRDAYLAVGGHAAVRHDPVEDVALGQRVKAMGLRWRLVDAGDAVRCRMYCGFREAVEGFSKNLFPVFRFRLLPYLFVWLWLGLITWEPLLVAALVPIGLGSTTFSLGPAAVAIAETLALWTLVLHRLRFDRRLALLYPISLLLFIGIALRSLVLTVSGKTTWKGRHLPRQRLRWI